MEQDTDRSQPTQGSGPYVEGKRAGAHPIVVILGVIVGLWLLMWLYVPSSKQKPGSMPERAPTATVLDQDAAPVMFHVKTTIPELNVIIVMVPSQATDSQVVGLLKRLRQARLDNALSTLVPATTPGHKLGDHAVAEIYIFSDAQYGTPEAVSVLARGAHAPGELYPQAIPFETAMEQVRGHYRIDLNDTGKPDQASLGFADESGVHSKHYQRIF
ncbi:MAG TPA: hypothetical protein VFL31_04950 [Nitrospiraceae bacterium]|nr:hypothetical protein [Nitrospiraceae bacterium]